MLSVFESPGGESPWISAHQCFVGLPAGGTFTFKDARCARLFALALHLLADRSAAARWLKLQQPELGRSIPLLLAQTEVGARTVERVLGRMERGAQVV